MNAARIKDAPALEVLDVGRDVVYEDAMARQSCIHAERVADLCPDTLLLLEHAPVFTLGTSAHAGNILWDAAQRAQHGVALAECSRGGDVTYHGPGQLVGYPIIKLRGGARQVLAFVHALEEALIRVVADFGVVAGRDARNRGLWVDDSKLAALGIRVTSGVSMHGFALNVSVDHSAYEGIVACGLHNASVTSMAVLLGEAPEMEQVKRSVVARFKEVLGYSVSDA